MVHFRRRTFLRGAAVATAATVNGVTVASAQPVWGSGAGPPRDRHEEVVRDARMLWRSLPEDSRGAPLLGNGSRTALVRTGGQGRSLVFTAGSCGAGEPSATATWELHLDGALTRSRWELDLWNAELSGTVVTTRGQLTVSAYVHREHDALLVSVAGQGGERATATGDVRWQEKRAGARRVFAVALADVDLPGLLARRPDALVGSHRRWWHEFYRASFVSVPDRTLQRFHWAQLYLGGAAVLPDRPVAARFPRFFSSTNHHDLVVLPGGPDSAAISDVHDHLAFGIPGIGSKSGRAQNPVLAMGLPAVWSAWAHSPGERVLRDYLHPKLRRAVGFYAEFLVEGTDGRLHLPPTHSPGHADVADSTHDLSLLRWASRRLLEAGERLDVPEPHLARWRDIHTRLTPYHVDARGVLVGAGTRLATSHPRPDHLLWLHPLREKVWRDEGDRLLMRRSVQNWASMAEHWDGLSHLLAASLFAAVRAPEEALAQVQVPLDGRVLGGSELAPNALYHQGSTVDTSAGFAGAQAVLDMLGSADGVDVDVFAAVPEAWRDVSVAGLRPGGPFVVDAARVDGRTEWVRVRAEVDGPLVLTHGIHGDLQLRAGDRRVRAQRSTGRTTLRLRAGETVAVARPGADLDAVAGVVGSTGAARRWGDPGIDSRA